jgi:2-oxo-4-hydroxy-4-carboxy--5-ureidoimidazoline (OHCU) decarboxylase
MLNCTYKTNRFDMPLLNCVRVNNRNTTFIVFLRFIDAETKDNYNFYI